jgi:hypothetical protein
MDQSTDFITDGVGGIFKKNSKKTVRQPVIKSTNLEMGQTFKVNAHESARAKGHEGNIYPVIEGDEIVGFVYECACGESAKILFEYEQSIGRAAS